MTSQYASKWTIRWPFGVSNIRGPPGQKSSYQYWRVCAILCTAATFAVRLSTFRVGRTIRQMPCSGSLSPLWSGNSLTSHFGCPDADLLVTPDSHLLPFYLTLYHQTEVGGLDAFPFTSNRWLLIYLFTPPATSLFLLVCHHLQSYYRRMLHIATW